MSKQVQFKVAAAGVVLLVLGVLVLWPAGTKLRTGVAEAPAEVLPDEILLTGILRDFSKTHPDFNVLPPGGAGHYAGVVQDWLPGDLLPVLSGEGFAVETQWRDLGSRPIAPHLYNTLPGVEGGATLGVRVAGPIKIEDDSSVDAFNSLRGPYGTEGNYGAGAYLSTNSVAHHEVEIKKKARVFGRIDVGPGGHPASVVKNDGVVTGGLGTMTEAFGMPDISLPPAEELGPSQGDVEIRNEVVTLVGDTNPDDESAPPALVYHELKLKENAVLQVDGELVIVVTHKLEIKDSAIVLLANASLTLFVTGNHDLDIEKSDINVSSGDASTSNVVILYLGDDKVKVKESHVYGTIIAPEHDGELELYKGHVYGAFVGKELKLKGHSGFHVDLANAAMSAWNPAITVEEKIEIDDRCDVDSFDSTLGAYDGPDGGGTNYGDDALLLTNAVKDDKVKVKKDATVNGHVLVGPGADPGEVIKLDDDGIITGLQANLTEFLPIMAVMPPAVPGDDDLEVEYENGSFVLSGDLRCKKLKLEKAVLDIQGDVTIRCEDKVEIKKSSEIRLLPGATLTIYVRKDFKVDDKCRINMNTGDPKLVHIRRMSLGKSGKVEIKDASEVCAWIQGAQTELTIENKSVLYGTFIGRKVKVKDQSQLHVDMAYLNNCVEINDVAGTAGQEGTGAVTTAETFAQWYDNVPGVNQPRPLSITLTNDGTGVYEFLEDQFHPIDGILLGNEGDAHNHHFTYALNARFEYEDCAGQFVEFQGGDGTWVYVNDRLVMDLGGVMAPSEQHLDLDRLGLSPGSPYLLRIFHAQRNPASSTFRLRTNVVLQSTLPSFGLQYD